MNILDVALAIQIRLPGEGPNEIGNMEARLVFLRLCAFAPIPATMVGVLELAAPEAPPVDAALRP